MNLRRLSEQDYYQVLEIPYDASSDDIQSAYDQAREMYGHDALVAGSILSEQERRNAYERIAQAYQTLIAEESRRLYDESLDLNEQRPFAQARRAPRGGERTSALPGETVVEGGETARGGSASTERPAEDRGGFGDWGEDADGAESPPSPSSPPAPEQAPMQLGVTAEATGEFLRSARESLGLDLTTIAEETKIGRSMLEYIENERLDRLPAPVYLRNFTLQIARCLGLDEEKVSRTYLARIRRLQSA